METAFIFCNVPHLTGSLLFVLFSECVIIWSRLHGVGERRFGNKRGGDCCDLLRGGGAGPRARQWLRKGFFF